MNKNVVEKSLILGAPASNNGFRYVIDAMDIYQRADGVSTVKVGDVYREIAQKYNTNYEAVERSIRHLFQCIYNRGIPQNLSNYFPDKQTGNGELLARFYYWLMFGNNEVDKE